MAARKRTERRAVIKPSEADARLEGCPVCGEKKSEIVNREGSRFPFGVQCRACGWTTDFVKLPGIAAKLWNEAQRKTK